MKKEFKEKGTAKFGGLSVSPSKVVNLKVKLSYAEIVTSVKLLQSLNADVTVQAKIPNEKAFGLGMFTIGSINFDKDGNANVQLKSLVDNVELENILKLVDAELLQLRFLAVLELPMEEVEENEADEEELPFN